MRYQPGGPTGPVDQALVDGIGGLEFQALSPPGIGRLIRMPFYLTTGVARFNALDGTNAAAAITNASALVSATHPALNVFPPAAAGATLTATLATPQISWAVMRIVGFEANVRYPTVPAADVMDLAFQQLQIGGGATLFVHEDFGPAGVYLVGQESFAGLRDYPVLKSPNTATVQCQAVGAANSANVNFSCNLVCEILTDDNYGSHIPGPYARAGAMVRQGGSFV